MPKTSQLAHSLFSGKLNDFSGKSNCKISYTSHTGTKQHKNNTIPPLFSIAPNLTPADNRFKQPLPGINFHYNTKQLQVNLSREQQTMNCRCTIAAFKACSFLITSSKLEHQLLLRLINPLLQQ